MASFCDQLVGFLNDRKPKPKGDRIVLVENGREREVYLTKANDFKYKMPKTKK